MVGISNTISGSEWDDPQVVQSQAKGQATSHTEYLGDHELESRSANPEDVQSAYARNDIELQDELRRRYGCEHVDVSVFDAGGKITTRRDGSQVILKRVFRKRDQAAAEIDRDITVRSAASDPTILPLIESLELREVIWTVIEYRPLQTVGQLIRENGPMPAAALKRTLNALFSGVASIFMAGFAHLRICDQTICFDDRQQLIITDLHYACEYGKEKTDDLYAVTREKYGNDIWVAPEVFSSIEYNARKATIWGCGVLIYFMATGQTEKLSIIEHPIFAKTAPEAESIPSSPSMFRRFSTAEPSPRNRRRSSASVQSKFLISLNVLDIPNYARWIIPKMLAQDPLRRAELIEIASRVPKEYDEKATRPLMETAWLDYKTHVGPLAGLEDPFNGNDSSASSIYSFASRISNPFENLLGGSNSRRRSVPVNTEFSRW